MRDQKMFEQMGKRLQIARAVVGISEQQAASDLGITLITYRKWEKGCQQRASTDRFVNFADKYDLSLDWLFIGEGLPLKSAGMLQ